MMPIYDISERLYFSYIWSIFNETILPYTFKAQTANIFTLGIWKYANSYTVENADVSKQWSNETKWMKPSNERTKQGNEKYKDKAKKYTSWFCSRVSLFRFVFSLLCYALLHIYQLYFEPRSLDITMLYSTSNALPDNQFFVSSLHTAHMFLKREKTKSIFDIW